MNTLAHRWLTAGILAIWATVLCTLYFTGRISSYLHPMFQPYAMACGVALAVFAVLILLAPEIPGDETGCESGKPRSTIGSLAVSFVLVVPLIVAVAFTRDEFGASTIMNRGYVETADQLPGGAAGPALPDENAPVDEDSGESAEDLPPPEIIDLLYAAQLPEMRPNLEGKTFDFVGQFMPVIGMDGSGDRFRIVRMLMLCCAADAQPVSVLVEMPKVPDIKESTWVKVRGRVNFVVRDGETVPVISGESVAQTAPPDDPFLY